MADMVNLYYLGGLRPPDKDRNFIVRSMGRSFTVPGPGEYLQVASADAGHIINRHKRIAMDAAGQPTVSYPAFTLDAKVAQMAAEGRVDFSNDGHIIEKVSYTKEELQAMLAELDAEEAGAEKVSEATPTPSKERRGKTANTKTTSGDKE